MKNTRMLRCSAEFYLKNWFCNAIRYLHSVAVANLTHLAVLSQKRRYVFSDSFVSSFSSSIIATFGKWILKCIRVAAVAATCARCLSVSNDTIIRFRCEWAGLCIVSARISISSDLNLCFSIEASPILIGRNRKPEVTIPLNQSRRAPNEWTLSREDLFQCCARSENRQ